MAGSTPIGGVTLIRGTGSTVAGTPGTPGTRGTPGTGTPGSSPVGTPSVTRGTPGIHNITNDNHAILHFDWLIDRFHSIED